MKCISCGAELKDENSAYCTQCGAPQKPAEQKAEPIKVVDLKKPEVIEEKSENTPDPEVVDLKKPETVEEKAPEPEKAPEENAPEEVEPIPEDVKFDLVKDIVAGAAEDEGNLFPEPTAEETEAAKIIAEDRQQSDGEAIAPEAEEAPEEQPISDKIVVGALRISGASLVAVVSMIVLLLVNLLVCVREGGSANMLGDRIRKMDIQTLISADVGGMSFSDRLFNASHFADASHNTADKESFARFMAQSDFLEFAAKRAERYSEYILVGNTYNPSVTANSIVDFYVDNADVSSEIFGYDFTIADYRQMRVSADLAEIEKYLSVDNWSDTVHFRLEYANFLFSYITIGIFAALFLVLIIWIAVIVDKQGRYLLGFYGTIFSWSGSVTLLVGVAVTAGAAVAHIITGSAIFYISASVLLPFGVLAIGIGGIETVLGAVFRRIKRAIKNKQKRNKAVEKAVADAVAVAAQN